MMDKLAKNFLQAWWRLREALVGKLRVEHRVLIHEPGRGEVQAVMARLLGPASEHKTEVVAKGLWRAWLDKARRRSGRPSKRQRSAFFVVHRGREPGLFYKWSDCQRSVANFPGARFKGFSTLAGAEGALACGLADPSSGGSTVSF